jgi:hypothetical protein
MSSKALSQFVSGLTNPKGNLGDFQHAARLFGDNDLRLAPKVKFLYHVSFVINTAALPRIDFKFRHQNEINMLVKSADLPKYKINTHTLNQYNRKKVVQTGIEYTPVTITFHDDNYGVTRQLWENYFTYYYADPTVAKTTGAYHRTATRAGTNIPYGFDNNSTIPFFKEIVIYQMAKKKWNSYALVNPMVSTWNHDTMDYSANEGAVNTMTLNYEAVHFDTGDVSQGSPPGFGVEHYDTMPSPITISGGGTRTLFGAGGVLAGASEIFGDISSGKAFEDPLSFVNTLVTTINTYQNARELNSESLAAEITGIATGALNDVTSSGSSVRGIDFPTSAPASDSTIATPREF